MGPWFVVTLSVFAFFELHLIFIFVYFLQTSCESRTVGAPLEGSAETNDCSLESFPTASEPGLNKFNKTIEPLATQGTLHDLLSCSSAGINFKNSNREKINTKEFRNSFGTDVSIHKNTHSVCTQLTILNFLIAIGVTSDRGIDEVTSGKFSFPSSISFLINPSPE